MDELGCFLVIILVVIGLAFGGFKGCQKPAEEPTLSAVVVEVEEKPSKLEEFFSKFKREPKNREEMTIHERFINGRVKE